MVLAGLLLGTGGCDEPRVASSGAIWEHTKIGDLGPRVPDPNRRATFMGTIRFDVYAIDLPADNIGKLDSVWEVLSAKPVRTNSYTAFAENGFRVRFGRLQTWKEVESLLAQAGGQGAGTTSLILSDTEPTDLPIADVPRSRSISFMATNLATQIAHVDSGVLVLRLRAEPVPGARGVRKIIAYPTHTPPMSITIPELKATARQREFYFGSAAFAARMSPGDLVVLAPNRFTGERDSLGGLFFNKATGAVFPDPERRRPPERKPTVRVFVLICTRMGD